MGIVKRKKISKMRSAPTKGQAMMSIIKKADLSHSSGIQYHFNENFSQAIPDSVIQIKKNELETSVFTPSQCGATAKCTKDPQQQ